MKLSEDIGWAIAYHQPSQDTVREDVLQRWKAKVGKMEEALQFYAKRESWTMTVDPNNIDLLFTEIDRDFGERAREALKDEIRYDD